MKKRMGAVLAVVLVAGGLMAPSATAATTACSGVSGCKIVSRADVDGDGRADQVGMVSKTTSSGERSSTVRVRTAKGRVMTTTTKGLWHPNPWHGAANIDGNPGYELVVGAHHGAHAQFFRVITHRNGRLVTLKAPGNQWTWHIDGSYSYNAGWFRNVSRGQVYMTSKGASRNQNSPGHDLRVNKYQWRNGTWSRISSSRTPRASNKAAYAAGGWHVPYLKSYARG